MARDQCFRDAERAGVVAANFLIVRKLPTDAAGHVRNASSTELHRAIGNDAPQESGL